MQLPLDIKALIDESTNIQTALETPISVSVYLDETAPADVVAHVRNKFASALPTVRMTIMYVGSNFAPQAHDDIAVMVAGTNPDMGKAAADLRASGVPVMMVTTLPVTVARLAQASGCSIPRGDLIFPLPVAEASDGVGEDGAAMATASLQAAEAAAIAQLPPDAARDVLQGLERQQVQGTAASATSTAGGTASATSAAGTAASATSAAGGTASATSTASGTAGGTASATSAAGTPAQGAASQTAGSSSAAEIEVPIALNKATEANLDNRMGRWIVSVCRDKRLAYAIAFPFVRRPLANDIVQVTALQNSAVGLVPFLPGADLPIMSLNQAKMVLQIAAAYGHAMDKERLKELAAVLGTAYMSRALVRELVKLIPVLGWAFRAGVAYGATAALGYALIEYFEGGENVTGVANVLEKAIGNGTKLATDVGGKAQAVMSLFRRGA